MANPRRRAFDHASMAVLLRHARASYASSMRIALSKAGYEDIPKNGLYVIGGLARQAAGHPLGELIRELKLSKQSAGQLVDTLVTRGYLSRDVDENDRRRLKIGLTARGRAAAKVVGTAGKAVDAELLCRIGPKDVERARRTLLVLIDMGQEQDAEQGREDSASWKSAN